MIIGVRFVGILRKLSGRTSIRLELNDALTIKELVSELIERKPALRSALASSPSDTLILVNGKDINVLGGQSTALGDRDEVIFVPIVHGG